MKLVVLAWIFFPRVEEIIMEEGNCAGVGFIGKDEQPKRRGKWKQRGY